MVKLAGSLATVAFVTMLGMQRGGQTVPQGQQTDRNPFSTTGRGRDEVPSRIQDQQAKSRNSDRQKRLVDDTNKLLSLATELKTDVDKTDKDVLSIDVIKKAEEIEKLAHSVKERMKG